MDLIDREELKKSILKWLPTEDYDAERYGLRFDENLVISLMMEIEEQPTVDAEPVVRCEHCIYKSDYLVGENHICLRNQCPVSGHPFGRLIYVKNTDFCSFGKRRGE